MRLHKLLTPCDCIQYHEGKIWVFDDVLATLIKRSTPKSEEAKLGALVVKFEQLEMTLKELFQSFTGRMTKCTTDIRVIDGSENPTDEVTIISTRHGIKKAALGLFLDY